MLTKIIKNNMEKNDLKTNHFFSIPENIINEIKEKGFSLYQWIGTKDVKLSIERDFLKYIKTFGTGFALLLIIPSVILYITGGPLFYFYFFGFLGFINIIFLIFLVVISIKRSSLLRKNAFVLITNSHISINGKIEKLDDYDINNDLKMKKISTLFEEELFMPSNIEKTKKGFFSQVLEQIGTGFKTIGKMGRGNSRNSGQLLLILFALYLAYIISLGIVYFIGIFFIWVFGIFLTIINKQILLISGHQITKINDKFEEIDESSKKLILEKNNLSKELKDAMNNDWKDGLLNKINSGISNINKYASNAVDTSIELKKYIKISKYSEMFNFDIYNSWIKKQIYIPIKQIQELLEKNLEILKIQNANIDIQILQTEDVSLKGPLVLSKNRVEMNIKQIEKHIISMGEYLDKLR